MALTTFQIQVLSLLASNRSPNSVFAGGAVANRDGPRISQDLDIEHHSIEAVRQSFAQDEATLKAAGYTVTLSGGSQPTNGFIEAVVQKGDQSVLLDWTNDTAVRFFPAIEDPVFGWRLHDADIAVNKLLALAGRRAPRDYYDVVRLHERGFPLVALAWAVMGKDAGMSPELVLDEAARNAIYPPGEIEREILSEERVDPVALKRTFLTALREARDLLPALTARIPHLVGKLPLGHDGQVMVPDPDAYDRGEIAFHEASVGGAWPSIGLGREGAFRPK
jgi:hypothetical protein